jgi:hypothetical protein
MDNWRRRVLAHLGQPLYAKTELSRLIHRIGEERLLDGGQREPRLVLRQQHLACAPANGAVFREPRQGQGAKKVSALGVSLKPGKRDMQQRVIGERN